MRDWEGVVEPDRVGGGVQSSQAQEKEGVHGEKEAMEHEKSSTYPPFL